MAGGLGDKVADLRPDQHARLRAAVSARGFAAPGGLAGDGIQLVEPLLLEDLLKLASEDKAVASAQAAAPQDSLAMLGAPHRLRTHLHHHAGDRTLLLHEGWSTGDPGTCRAVGAASTARAGIVPPASRQLLSLTLIPMAADPAVRHENSPIEIVVNGRLVGEVRLDPKWQKEGADLAFWLPPELVGGKPFEITFRHSRDFMLDRLKLSQGRALPDPVLDPAELMLQFENIGDNCEFGLVQRHFNAEPVGLLRFAGLGDPRRLIRFLDDDFGRFGEPGSFALHVIGGEYWVIDPVYGIAYHTFRYPGQASVEDVTRENEIKVGYLRRKFLEDLEDGQKIMVYKRVVTRDPHEIIALHAALNRLGAVNKLLWVTQADGRHAPGDVEWLGERLLKGYLGAISLSDAHDFDPETWLRLCRNAVVAFEAARPD